MAGPSLLVRPVRTCGQSDVMVTLPPLERASSVIWYDFDTNTAFASGREISAHAPIDKVPFPSHSMVYHRISMPLDGPIGLRTASPTHPSAR